jgi:hypothetical protein
MQWVAMAHVVDHERFRANDLQVYIHMHTHTRVRMRPPLRPMSRMYTMYRGGGEEGDGECGAQREDSARIRQVSWCCFEME